MRRSVLVGLTCFVIANAVYWVIRSNNTEVVTGTDQTHPHRTSYSEHQGGYFAEHYDENEGEFDVMISNITFGILSSPKSLSRISAQIKGWHKDAPKLHYMFFMDNTPEMPAYDDVNTDLKEDYSITKAVEKLMSFLYERYKDNEEVQWFFFGDDDTFIWPQNLIKILRKYDPKERYYVGGVTEDRVNLRLFGNYAFGGAGAMLSRAAMKAMLDPPQCGFNVNFGDEAIGRCAEALTIQFYVEPGFRQSDFRGDATYALQSFYDNHAPVSLHHMWYWTMFPDISLEPDTSSPLPTMALVTLERLYSLFRVRYSDENSAPVVVDYSHYGFNKFRHYSHKLGLNIELSFGYWAEIHQGKFFNFYDKRLLVQYWSDLSSAPPQYKHPRCISKFVFDSSKYSEETHEVTQYYHAYGCDPMFQKEGGLVVMVTCKPCLDPITNAPYYDSICAITQIGETYHAVLSVKHCATPTIKHRMGLNMIFNDTNQTQIVKDGKVVSPRWKGSKMPVFEVHGSEYKLPLVGWMDGHVKQKIALERKMEAKDFNNAHTELVVLDQQPRALDLVYSCDVAGQFLTVQLAFFMEEFVPFRIKFGIKCLG